MFPLCVTRNQLVLESSLTVTGNGDNHTSYTRRTPCPCLDTPPKWLPGIDGIQINFHLKVFFPLLNWNILKILYSVLKFCLKQVSFTCLEFLSWIFFSTCVWNGDVWMLGWFFWHLLFSCLEFVARLVVCFVPFKTSVPHFQGQNRPYQPVYYLWNEMKWAEN